MSLLKAALPALAISAFALSACSNKAEEDVTYEVGVEDVGGGELQVADPKPGDVQVDLPETPMKNVPAEGNADETQEQ